MFLKNINIIFKIKISKVTDYAALRCCQKLTIRQCQNVWQHFNGQSIALKVACSNPRFTKYFFRKDLFVFLVKVQIT